MLLGLTYQLIRFIADIVLVRTRSDAQLRAEVLALRHQLRVLERRVDMPAWQPGDRLLLAARIRPSAHRRSPRRRRLRIGRGEPLRERDAQRRRLHSLHRPPEGSAQRLLDAARREPQADRARYCLLRRGVPRGLSVVASTPGSVTVSYS
jgi:hypothetical protein